MNQDSFALSHLARLFDTYRFMTITKIDSSHMCGFGSKFSYQLRATSPV